MKCLLIAALFAAPSAFGQVQLDAGAGNLLTGGAYTEGVGLTAYLPSSEIRTSFSVKDGHPIFGISDAFVFRGIKLTAGDQQIGLITGSVGLGLGLKGISIQKDTLTSTIKVFVGGTGPATFLPFSSSTKPQHISTGLLGKKKWNGFEISGLAVTEASVRTAIGAMTYDFRNTLKVSTSAGILNNNRYAQTQATYQISQHVYLAGGHSSFFSPFRATGDSINVGLTAGRWNANAGLNRSVSQGIARTGENISLGSRFAWLSVQSSVYRSGNQRVWTNSFSQNLRRLTVTQIINRSDRTSLGAAVSFRGSRFSVSVGDSMQFLLNGRGYSQVLYANVSFRIRDVLLNAATVTNAVTGKPLWSVGSENYVQAGSAGLGLPGHQSSRGKYVLSGTVVDDLGAPVSGACLQIGRRVVYSNDQGNWALRTPHNKPQPVTVLSEEFQIGSWRVVSAPTTASSGTPVIVVVKKVIR